MSPPRRAIISITSASAVLHGSHKTGLFISEAMHPYNVFKKAGFEVDFVSETGKYEPDWLSEQSDFLKGDDVTEWQDVKGEFRQKLDNMYKPEEVDADAYGIFFASAGHAAIIDYPDAKGLQKIATRVWANGWIVSSVCHGPCLFPGVIDHETGKSICAGKTITGFTTEGEDVMGLMEIVRSWGKPLVEDHAAALGAKYVRPPGVWDAFHVTDGRLVTGTNPASALETAEAVLEVFKTL